MHTQSRCVWLGGLHRLTLPRGALAGLSVDEVTAELHIEELPIKVTKVCPVVSA